MTERRVKWSLIAACALGLAGIWCLFGQPATNWKSTRPPTFSEVVGIAVILLTIWAVFTFFALIILLVASEIFKRAPSAHQSTPPPASLPPQISQSAEKMGGPVIQPRETPQSISALRRSPIARQNRPAITGVTAIPDTTPDLQQARPPIPPLDQVEVSPMPPDLPETKSSGMVERSASEVTVTRAPAIADAPAIPEPSLEGKRRLAVKLVPERDPQLRADAVRLHGNSCCLCGFKFDEKYAPDVAQGYIEVHHLRPVSKGRRMTDPRTDLITLCSNCHKMADRATKQPNPPTNLEELRLRLFP